MASLAKRLRPSIASLQLAQIAFFRIDHAHVGFAHPHDFPVMQKASAVNHLARHFDPILGPQIANDDAFLATFEGSVLTRNIVVGDDQVAMLATAELEHAATRDQCQLASQARTSHHHKPRAFGRGACVEDVVDQATPEGRCTFPDRARPIVGQLAIETQLDPCEVDNVSNGNGLDDVWNETPPAKRSAVGAAEIFDVRAAIAKKEPGVPARNGREWQDDGRALPAANRDVAAGQRDLHHTLDDG